MNYKIVMFSGLQGSGKSTAAMQLYQDIHKFCPHFGRAQILKFATPLYKIHDSILNEMERMSGIPRVKKDGPLLQYLGTDWGRNNFGSDIWVRIIKAEMADISSRSPTAVVFILDDCRFENEFDAFPEAFRIRLSAPEEIRRGRAESWRENTNHPSETGLDKYEKEKKFDLVFNTYSNIHSPGAISNLVIDQLKRNVWRGKRGQSDIQ